MSSMPVHLEEIHDLAALPADVAALFEVAERQDFELGLDWYRLLQRTALQPKERVFVLVCRREGRPVAALPLMQCPGMLGPEIHSLTNFYTSLFAPVLSPEASESDLVQLFTKLRSRRPRASLVMLSPMARESPHFPLLRDALRKAGLASFEYFCFGNWYLPLAQKTGSADEYMAARPGEVRQTLRRMRRRFEREGGRIEVVTADTGLEDAIAAYLTVYAASWKQAEPHPHFMPELMRLCARRGWLRLGVARVGEQPIAAQLWIVCGRRACIYKLAYDNAFSRLSPGSLLTETLMRHAIEQDRVTEVDYLTGDDDYKKAWMSHRRERWGLVAYDSLTPGGALLRAREVSIRLLKQATATVRSAPR